MVADKEAVQFPKFNSYVCHDESVSFSHEGVMYQATIRYDEDSHIDDDDVHNPDKAVTGCDDDQFKKLLEAREAWFKDEWWYGWIEVTSTFNGYKLKSTASVSRVEVNYPGSRNEYLSEAATELLSNLITEVDDELNDIIKCLMREMLKRRIASRELAGEVK